MTTERALEIVCEVIDRTGRNLAREEYRDLLESIVEEADVRMDTLRDEIRIREIAGTKK